jgi:nitrite reductase (NADH) small subunit
MWVDVMTADDLAKARKQAVTANGVDLALNWHEGQPYAFLLHCIHKQRELTGGVVLNGRLVCPGHQWAYELDTGWCRERERCQPTYPVRVEGGRVLVDVEPAAAGDAVASSSEVG